MIQISYIEFNNEKATELLEKYHNSTESQQRIVEILTINFIDTTPLEIRTLYGKENITELDVRTDILPLKKRRLVLEIRGRFQVNPLVRELVFEILRKRCSKDNVVDSIMERALYWGFGYGYIDKLASFRIHFARNNMKWITAEFQNVLHGTKNSLESLAISFFNSPFIKSRVEQLPTIQMQQLLLHTIINGYFTEGVPLYSIEPLEMLFEIMDEDQPHHSLYLSAQLYLKWNNLNHVISVPNLPENSTSLRFQAIEEVMLENWDEARILFGNAIKLLKTKSREPFFSDPSILFYTLTILQNDDSEEIRSFIRAMKVYREVTNTYSIHGAIPALIALCEVSLGETSVSEVRESILDPQSAKSFYGLWVILLCNYWLDTPGFNEKVQKVLVQFDENSALPFLETDICKMSDGEGVVSLFPKIERWQGAIKGIVSLLSPKAKVEQKSERLVWRILNDEYIDIDFYPVLQKIGKNGQWTQGRQVKFNELKYQFNKLATSANDRKIMELNIEQGECSWNRTVSNSEERQRLISLAFGHPLLFDSQTREKISLKRDELRLITTRKGAQIEVKTVPQVSRETGISVIPKGDVWHVTFANSKQSEITHFIGDCLLIPAKEAAQVASLFEAIGDTLIVEGEKEALGKGLNAVDGFTTPHLLIEPYEEGLSFRLRAAPSDDNQLFLPGKGKNEYVGNRQRTSVIINRDFNVEKENALSLIDSIAQLAEIDRGDFLWEIPEALEALDILVQLKESPQKPVLNWPKGESMKIAHHYSSSDLFQTVSKERDWFELSGKVQVSDTEIITLKQMMDLSENSTSRFIKMANGEYLALTRSLKQELDTLNTYSTKSRSDKVKLHPLAILPLEDSYIAQESPDALAWIEQFKTNHAKNFRIPKSARVELRDYQVDGFRWLMRLAQSNAGALLADDMGLGKTVQAIMVLIARQKQGPSLIVVPASLSFNWLDEIKRFAPSLTPQILGNENREGLIKRLKAGDVLITSYGLVQRNQELFTSREWHTVVLDEAQAVKNATTQRTRSIKAIPRKFTLITTGTPVENHLGELWNLFDIILPGFMGSVKNFREKYQIPIEKNDSRQVRSRLKKLISPFILRRTKEQVLTELPPKTAISITVEMSSQEQALYEATRQRALERIKESGKQDDARFTVLAEITRLRQACCHPRLIDKNSEISSAKLELFGEKVGELLEGNHQGLVFSQFVGHLKLIAEYLDLNNISYFYLDGSTPSHKRGDLVKGFQAGDRPLFLISLKAGGSGLNLTGADYVFHMDPWWNPAVEDQASDRAHRIGQQRPVTIYRFITAGSIEEKIIALHKEKRNLAESLLEGTTSALKLQTNELVDIISGKY